MPTNLVIIDAARKSRYREFIQACSTNYNCKQTQYFRLKNRTMLDPSCSCHRVSETVPNCSRRPVMSVDSAGYNWRLQQQQRRQLRHSVGWAFHLTSVGDRSDQATKSPNSFHLRESLRTNWIWFNNYSIFGRSLWNRKKIFRKILTSRAEIYSSAVFYVLGMGFFKKANWTQIIYYHYL